MSRDRIIIWWETRSDVEKWHVEVFRNNGDSLHETVLGSGSSDFPVKVDEFGPFEEDLLIQSLKSTFPQADIRLKF